MEFDLDDAEREIFDEINIVPDEPVRRPSKPHPSRQFRKQVSFDDGMDEPVDMFANNSKMNISQPPPPVEWDGGDGLRLVWTCHTKEVYQQALQRDTNQSKMRRRIFSIA